MSPSVNLGSHPGQPGGYDHYDDSATMSSLLPRVYQEKVMEIAASRNTICRMDTGTGKTLIAVMLSKHVILERKAAGHSLVVFLVPTVSLVDQTTNVLRAQTDLNVKSFFGARGTDYYKKDMWIDHLLRAQIIVCTAQIWLNALSNSYWDMDRTSLIIFDEAHHATKEHPYSLIMKDHYHTIPEGQYRPRILGLTASPVWNPKKPQKAINELEANLHCRIYEVSSEHGPELSIVAAKPTERLVTFDRPRVTPLTFTNTAAENILISAFGIGKIDSRLTIKLAACRSTLGTLATTLYARQIAQQIKAPLDVQTRISELCDSTEADETTTSSHVQALLRILESYRPDVDSEDEDEDEDEEEDEAAKFHAIVFVQQRQHTQLLADIVLRDPTLKDWLRPACLVGHGGTAILAQVSEGEERYIKDKGIGMKSREQQEVVATFRTGEYNLLFATSVAEEGLDFRTCNCVIRFDGLQTMTGYIQSRGRARSAESDYIVLAQRGSPAAESYSRYVISEPVLRTMYTSRPLDQAIPEPELGNFPSYVVESTRARLTYQSAVPLVAQVCALLNKDPTSQLRPKYTSTGYPGQWVCTLRTPIIPAFGGARAFESEPATQKKIAKQAVAFACCVALHKAGALNDNLQVPRKQNTTLADSLDVDGRRVDYAPVDEKGIWTTYEPAFKDPGRPENDVWCNIVEVLEDGKVHRVALVCANDLQAVFSHAESRNADMSFYGPTGAKVTVRVPESALLTFEDEDERELRLEQLRKLNWGAAKTSLNRKLKFTAVDNFVALWAPLAQNSAAVDWSKVERPYSPALDAELGDDTILIIRSARPTVRLGAFLKVRDDVHSLAPAHAIECYLQPGSTRHKLLKTYYTYAKYCSAAYNHSLDEEIPEPIIDMDPWPTPTYTLIPPETPEVAPTSLRTRPYPLSMCSVSALGPAFWRIMHMTPALNRLIEDNIQLCRVEQYFSLPPMNWNHLRQALTPPMANTGFDYQYLETIGDSVLKIATTLHIYLSRETAEEGVLSILRHHSVSNAMLRARNIETGFSSYILGAPFETVRWEPGESGTRGRSDGYRERRINRRALSDTVESILGATFATGGLPAAMIVGDRLGLCFGGTSPWVDRPAARALWDVEASPVPPQLLGLQDKLGYKFRQGNRLLEAMTHRSNVDATTDGYDRLEYLGDALLDFWAVNRLFAMFPESTPQHLTNLRTVLVSNPSLGYMAIRMLDMPKYIQHSSPLLTEAMDSAVKQSAGYDWDRVVNGDMTWLWEPPKALGDCLEAAIGAIFIDAKFEFEPVYKALDRIYGELMPLMSVVDNQDPYSILLNKLREFQCEAMTIKNDRPETDMNYTAVCTFHGKVLCTQQSKSKTVARQLAARHAVERLCLEPDLLKLCDCANASSLTETSSIRDALPEINAGDDDGDSPMPPVASGRISPDPNVAGGPEVGAHPLVGTGPAGSLSK